MMEDESAGENGKRWYARDPNNFLATAQIQVVPATDYDALELHCRQVIAKNERHLGMLLDAQAEVERLMADRRRLHGALEALFNRVCFSAPHLIDEDIGPVCRATLAATDGDKS
jgi:hypothetical protein